MIKTIVYVVIAMYNGDTYVDEVYGERSTAEDHVRNGFNGYRYDIVEKEVL